MLHGRQSAGERHGGHHPANAGREAAQSIRYRSGPPAALFITVDNTYGEADTSIEQIDGDLVSTKHGGTGLGTDTVRETAERHHGTASFEHSDGMFRASVMLCLGD